MRNRRHVLDRLDLQSRGGQRLNRRLTTRARTLHAHVHALHAKPERLTSALLGGDGVPADKKAAVEMFSRACDRSPYYCYNLAVAFRDQRAEQSRTAAVVWAQLH